jgi:cytochrome c553
MKKGEKGILVGLAVFVVAMMGYKSFSIVTSTEKDPGIPFYTTSTKEFETRAVVLVRKLNCRACHVLWAQRTIMQSVPAPSLDGIGSLRTEEWFYTYLSAENPQAILPSRLKAEFRMPSYSQLSEDDRRMLAKYLSSLKVEDWYLEETKANEHKKLIGTEYKS